MADIQKAAPRAAWLLVCALLGACSNPVSEASNRKTDDPPQKPNESLRFEVVRSTSGELSGVVPGRLAFKPTALAAVNTPIQARIVAIHVSPGQFVSSDTPLATLQGSEVAGIRSALEQAEARNATAEDALKRQQEMMQKGVGLEAERFAAETAAREARSELARATRAAHMIGDGDGDAFILRTPKSGVVTAVRGHLGAMASPDGEPLFDVGDTSNLGVVADVPESDIIGIDGGQRAEVSLPLINRSFPAVVDTVGRVVDGEQRRAPVYLSFEGDGERLTAGMLAEVRFHIKASSVISLPIEAVLIKDGAQRIVYVLREDGRLEARPVIVSASRDGRVTVSDGLHPGDSVVVHGALLLDSSAEQLL